MLDRSGESTYFINGMQVRRKDVIDLFLGTGLGPRAYAIIEQGMISRIIEAKPEEVRGFLEEAAGVTKYRERRKETEGRLCDARDNLTRLDDIRSELGQQLGKLEQQAAIAEKYRQLNASLSERQNLLWLLKRNEARAERAPGWPKSWPTQPGASRPTRRACRNSKASSKPLAKPSLKPTRACSTPRPHCLR